MGWQCSSSFSQFLHPSSGRWTRLKILRNKLKNFLILNWQIKKVTRLPVIVRFSILCSINKKPLFALYKYITCLIISFSFGCLPSYIKEPFQAHQACDWEASLFRVRVGVIVKNLICLEKIKIQYTVINFTGWQLAGSVPACPVNLWIQEVELV